MKKLFDYLLKYPFFIQLFNWEYWPFSVVYAPIYLFYIWYGLRSGSFFFFTAANPSIKNGGFLMETKSDIDPIIPNEYKPTTVGFDTNTSFEHIKNVLLQHQLSFPLIIKPDNGARGRGVKKVNNEAELLEVLPCYTVHFIIQPYIPFPKEIGLFYVRMPNETKGKVTGIVRKEFVQVTGDGVSTVLQLLRKNTRYVLQIPILQQIIKNQLNVILPQGKTEVLLPYGNHARGCLFLDDSHLIDERLEKVFNEVCLKIEGFFYGRMDIRFNTWEELLEGKNFSIIELNGSGSEPTHIYDPKHTILFAWGEIIRHLKWLYKISVINHKNGTPFLTVKEGLAMFKENAAYDKMLNALIV